MVVPSAEIDFVSKFQTLKLSFTFYTHMTFKDFPPKLCLPSEICDIWFGAKAFKYHYGHALESL